MQIFLIFLLPLSGKFVQTNFMAAAIRGYAVTEMQQELCAMAAYMIITAKIADRDAFIAGYGAAAGALVEQFGGRYVLRGPGAQLLEGSFGDGASMVISEWPDVAAAQRFWNSPEYAAARTLREGIADVQVLLIEAPKINA
jgi:uncharacterized protein (DUF1330 family)